MKQNPETRCAFRTEHKHGVDEAQGVFETSAMTLVLLARSKTGVTLAIGSLAPLVDDR